jgi:hypothetical protein
MSLPVRKGSYDRNVFAMTKSRLHIPTDVLFARLSNLRRGGRLTSIDEALRTKITTPLYVARDTSTISLTVPVDPDNFISSSDLQPY